MASHPYPEYRLLSSENIKYTVTHENTYSGPDNPENDDSHIHDCYEIYMNISGDVSFLVNNQLYPIDRGSVIFTRPGDVHLCIYKRDCKHEHFCLWIDVSADSPLLTFANEHDFGNFIVLEEQATEQLIHQFYRFSDSASSELSKNAAFFEILCILQSPQKDTSEMDINQFPKEMQQILTYLNIYYKDIQYIKEIYDIFYISPATLNRWFRKYIHISPRQFLESKKLAYAKQLLHNGSSVTEAAMQSGFSDCSYFIAVFKKKFGTTPTAYKKQL